VQCSGVKPHPPPPLARGRALLSSHPCTHHEHMYRHTQTRDVNAAPPAALFRAEDLRVRALDTPPSVTFDTIHHTRCGSLLPWHWRWSSSLRRCCLQLQRRKSNSSRVPQATYVVESLRGHVLPHLRHFSLSLAIHWRFGSLIVDYSACVVLCLEATSA
jgi:hypothetical protein